MVQQVRVYGQVLQFPDDMDDGAIAKAIQDNEHILNPDFKQPEGFSGIAQNIVSGTKQTGRMVGAGFDTVRNKLSGVEEYARSSDVARQQETPIEQKKLLGELSAIDREQGALGQIGDTLSAAGRNPMGTAQMITEQLPNTVVSLGGGVAGAKTGALAGSVFGPVGATIGGTLGFLGGMLLGNALLETGSKAIEKASDEDGYTPEDRDAAMREGAIKGAVITGVDAATLKLGGMVTQRLGNAAVNAGAKAEAKVLMDAGVDMTSTATINAALKTSPELMKQAKLAGEKAAIQALSRSKKAGIVGTGLAMETAGEGVGEYLGEMAATGKGDVVDATIEALSSATQSIAETAYNFNKLKAGNDLSADNIRKVAGSVNDHTLKEGLDNISKSSSVDEAIKAANNVVSEKPVTSDDVLVAADPTLLDVERLTGLKPTEAIEQITQPQGTENVENETSQETQQTSSQKSVLLGNDTEIVLPDGQSIPAKWGVVDADQVSASIKEGVNQPRDRARAASDIQIQSIANNPDYRRLSDSVLMDTGSPTLSHDGLIVGGNGRFEGINRSHEIGSSAKYRESLLSDSLNKGIDPSLYQDMKKPVLVRQITQPFDTRKLAVASNSGTNMQYSGLELAKIDAGRMAGIEDLDIADNGDIPMTGGNIQKIRQALSDYNPTEVASLIDKSGALSQDGVRRIRNSLLAKAYGSSETLGRLVESTDNDQKNVLGALTKSARSVASVRAEIKAGSIPKEVDITENLLDAVETLAQIRAKGQPLDQYLAQQNMFGDNIDADSKEILQFLHDNIRSQKRMAEFINNVYDQIGRIDTSTEDIFGDNVVPTKKEVINNAKPTEQQAEQQGIFSQQKPGGSNQPESKTQADNAGSGTKSWIVREKSTGKVIFETFDKKKVDALNTEKYEAVPTKDHLVELNNPNSKVRKYAERPNQNEPGFSRSAEERLKDHERAKQLEKKLKAQGFNFSIKASNVWNGDALDWSGSTKAEAQTAERIAKIFEKRIVWIEAKGDHAINGVVIPSIKDTVYIDVNTNKAVHVVLGHELSHHLEFDKPEVYKELTRSLITVIRDHKGYAKKYGIDTDNEAYIVKEIIGDIMGDNFADPAFWNRVAEANPSTFKSIADTIIAWLKKLVTNAKMRGMGSEQWVTDVKKAQDIVADAIAKYTNNSSDTTSDQAKFHKVWHGSPHDHDKFDKSKIGTGEGAAAYGYGHYFASNKEVAEYYKKVLTDGKLLINGTPFEPQNYKITEIVATHKGDDDSLVDRLETYIAWNKSNPFAFVDDAKKVTDAIKSGTLTRKVGGKLYEVELAPEQEDYLLWDKPLSEQSEKVKEALKGKIIANGTDILSGEKQEGRDIYKLISQMLDGDKNASEFLHKQGIRGIKYLDGSSRSSGEGQFNYVMFSDDDITIEAKFSRAVSDDQNKKTFSEKISEYKNLQGKLFNDDLIKNMDLDKFRSIHDSLQQIRSDVAKALDADIIHAIDAGGKRFLSRNTTDSGNPWRITYLNDGEPNGHSEYRNPKSAVDDLFTYGISEGWEAMSDDESKAMFSRASQLNLFGNNANTVSQEEVRQQNSAKSGDLFANNSSVENDLVAETVAPVPEESQEELELTPEKTSSKIDDFGEKLGGARKDMERSLNKEYTDDDIATQPLSKIWPKDDYLNVEDPFLSAFYFASREEIPTKPKLSYRVNSWVEKVKMFRGLAKLTISGAINEQRILEFSKKFPGLDHFFDRAQVLARVTNRQDWGRVERISIYPDAGKYDENGIFIKTPMTQIKVDGRTTVTNVTDIDQIAESVNNLLQKDAPSSDKKMQFEIRGRVGSYFINKKGDREYRKLKTFSDLKSARDYFNNNHDDLVAAWELVKESDNVKKSDIRSEENRPRTGQDWRKGKDVTPEQFQSEFGFRGVEFGNWVSQGKDNRERQGMLNQAYDALMDLSSIVGVPPKALSLDGSLGLGFGSRGKGAALAHFEPDALVINLTKTKGAGNLAHEWFHAMDNYFQRQRDGERANVREDRYITYRPEPMMMHKKTGSLMTQFQLEKRRLSNPGSGYFSSENWIKDPKHPLGVRPEIEAKFSDLVQTLDASPMKKRAEVIDKGKEDGYWSRIIERAARSFENYVIAKMMKKGYNNDYLANVTNAESFARDKERYPYLLESEVAPVEEAFDNLFAEIKTKETDKGVAMFSRRAATPETINIDGVDRPTRNSEGKLIHPSEEGVRNFWKWFSGSKVTDDMGRPMVVYHGSPDLRFIKEDGTFKSEKGRYGFGRSDAAHWFTNELSTAKSYADPKRAFDYQNAEEGIVEAYIKITDPLVINAQGSEWRSAQRRGSTSDVIESAKVNGNDGVVIKSVKDNYNNNSSTRSSNTFTVFDSNQIKSANDNSGTFSSENDDIRFSRRIHGDEPSNDDYVVPETPEFEGSMTGNLAYTPVSAIDKGVEQLPIRLTVGVARELHRGYGIEHIADNAKRDSRRMPTKHTDDLAENISREVTEIASSFNDIYEDNNRFVLRLGKLNKAIIVEPRNHDGERFYSVVTEMPLRGDEAIKRYGKPVWSQGRLAFPNDRLLQSSVSGSPLGQESQQPKLKERRNQTSKFHLTADNPKNQDKLQTKVTIKKRRVVKQSDGNDGPKFSFVSNPVIENTEKSDIPEETKFRKAQRLTQDAFNRFTVIKDWLAERGQKLSEKADVYAAEERYHSRVANQLEDFREKIRNPLIEKIAKAGFTLSDVSDFLEAQHAEEANAAIQKLTDDPDATAYGITDKEAQEYLKNAPPELATLANELRNVTQLSKELRLKNGLLSQEEVAAWESVYKHYIPVKGDSEANKGTGKGLKVNFKTKRRLGHGKRDEAVIENILMDHERAIMQVEKNRVAKHLVMMAAEIGMPELMTIGQPEKRKVLKNTTAFEVQVKGVTHGVFDTREAANMFKKLIPATNKTVAAGDIVIVPTTDQRVVAMASQMLSDNEVNAYFDGHAIRIQINDELLARAYGKLGVTGFSAIVNAGRALNGYLSKVYTGYNPEFIITNLIRDFTSGVINLTGEQGIKMAAKTVGNYGKSFASLLKYAATGESNTWIDRYRNTGGNTGAAYLSDLERLGDEVKTEFASYQGVISNLKQKDFANASRAAGRKVFNKTLKWIYVLNQAGENAMRLSAFRAMIESGESPLKAASVAKNITVNFNRKGEFGAEANAAYLFFNASVQGTAAIAHSLTKGKHKYEALALSGAMTTLGYLAAAALAGGDEDEYDKINDYTKERNLLIKAGDGFVQVPVPYGYGFFWNLGRSIADAQRKGEMGKLPWHIASSAIEELTPFSDTVVGNDGEFQADQVFLGLLPTVAKIPAQPILNKQLFSGGELMPDSPFKQFQPDREKMWRATQGTMFDHVAGWLEAGLGVDVSPETLKHYTRTFTGGAGNMVDTTVSAALLKSQGAELETSEIPFYRKSYTELTIRDHRSAYYKASEEAKKAAEEFSRAKEKNDLGLMKQVLEDKKELIALDKYASKLSKVISVVRDEQDAIRMSDTFTAAEKRLRIKESEIREQKLYDQYLDVFKTKTVNK